MAESVFSGSQWTTSSGSTWAVVIEPDFVNAIAELANHLALASQDARAASEKLVERAQAASSADAADDEAQKAIVKEIVEGARTSGLTQGAEARDIEGFANLVASLIRTLFKDAEADQLVSQLAEGVSKAGSNESSTTRTARYNAISSLFNTLPETASYQTRAAILLSLFKLAVSKDDLSVLSTALLSLPTWITSEWNIADTSAQDEIMTSFVDALESSNNDKEESSEIVRKLLYAYAGANTSESLREKLLFYTLAHPTNLHDVDLESLPSASSNAALNQLKEIFLSGSVADIDSFLASNNGVSEKLDKEKIKEKLQYVILADYCAGKVGQDISYDEVADVLGLSKSDDEEERAMQVEIWVIATIRVKLLTARLHQPSSTISILQASPRRFSEQQWSLLQGRLESWKASIASIQDTVGRALGGRAGPGPSGQQQSLQIGNSSANAQDVVNAATEQQQVVEVA